MTAKKTKTKKKKLSTQALRAVGKKTATSEPKKEGRPTKYDPAFVDMVDIYIGDNQDKRSPSLPNKVEVNLPTVEGFAGFLNIAKSTLYLWRQDYKEFSDALGKIEIEQHKRLLNSGLSGQYNSTIAKLVLSANHGMREKTEHDHTSGGQPLTLLLDE